MVGACTDITDMPLVGNVNTPAFQTMGSMFDDAMLVHKNLLCYVLLAIDIPTATYSVVTLPI